MSCVVMLVAAVISVPVIALIINRARKLRKPQNKKVISVFTRYPSPGVTKTRLIPCLGEEAAAYAQRRMTEHILERIRAYCNKRRDTDLAVWYNGSSEDKMRFWLTPKVGGYNFLYFNQQPPGGLGEKLREATLSGFRGNREYVVIVGSDIPGLTSDVMEEAFETLEGGADMVLGQAEDGGYYLVGFSKKAAHKIGEVFEGMDWGTDQVFVQQCEKAKQLDLNLLILDTKLSDVDTKEDLPVLENALRLSRRELTDRNWSVIIPTMNEEDTIADTLQTVYKNCSSETKIQEIIVSDGGSKDNTVQKVKDFSLKVNIPVKVIHSQPGRGFQQKSAAEAATGDFLLFLHSDTRLPRNFDISAESCLKTPGNVAGSFTWSVDTQSDDSWFFKLQMKIVTYFTNKRIQMFEYPFGDNAIFTSRHVYEKIGGIKEVYLLEDVLMSSTLKSLGAFYPKITRSLQP
ncbi:uncharacterized protein LOC125655392 isoform X2 [Ostrea edulis]|uniref:uncharacterized protein LOC125655392 isoform X2 n=1 Tax=Ostrea edulis TaxID=37623 RepID=UPI0024AFFFDA|nr:uncharacterized protein LOC125655392 isoform X2 [Ostrea edulis]